mmetsp:Transcript_16170/g.33214  ORF Transcript_16170/g.33214 Transcript_16170/m.33214 type:complete len:203 (+) Transcript_16170:1367-1975(+)
MLFLLRLPDKLRTGDTGIVDLLLGMYCTLFRGLQLLPETTLALSLEVPFRGTTTLSEVLGVAVGFFVWLPSAAAAASSRCLRSNDALLPREHGERFLDLCLVDLVKIVVLDLSERPVETTDTESSSWLLRPAPFAAGFVAITDASAVLTFRIDFEGTLPLPPVVGPQEGALLLSSLLLRRFFGAPMPVRRFLVCSTERTGSR